MGEVKPKWNRRKDDRPAEIASAALDLFIEYGFAGTKLSDVAARAGVVKGTLYRYFDTKEDLFRAVVRGSLSANLGVIEQAAADPNTPLADVLAAVLPLVAQTIGDSRLPAMLRMVVAESRAFPDLATIWHDEIIAKALSLLTGLISAAQERGEVRAGDPKLHALSLVGPLVAGILFREVFGATSSYAPDIRALADLHVENMLQSWAASS